MGTGFLGGGPVPYPTTIRKGGRAGVTTVLVNRFAARTKADKIMYVAIGPKKNKNNIYYMRRYYVDSAGFTAAM